LKDIKRRRRVSLKINDLILRTVTKLIVFIILTLAIYLFFSGHDAPGGGFIGGLVLASAIVLLLLTYDIVTIKYRIPFLFKIVSALVDLIILLTDLDSINIGVSFVTRTFATVILPLLGEVELSTVTFFELGVGLVVVSFVATIMLSISEYVLQMET